MLEAAKEIKNRKNNINFVLAENSNIASEMYTDILKDYESLNVSLVKDNTFETLNRCEFAIVTSGTATLETAIMEKPMVIAYKAAFLTSLLYHLFVRLPFIGLANIIAGEEVAPEFIQGKCTPENLSASVLEIITNDDRMRETRLKLRKVKTSLGEKGASLRAAEIIHEFIKEKNLI